MSTLVHEFIERTDQVLPSDPFRYSPFSKSTRSIRLLSKLTRYLWICHRYKIDQHCIYKERD